MKPDWKDAPEWAQWLAMDRSGRWYWFDKKPELLAAVWDNGATGSVAPAIKCAPGWSNSLEPRP